jgi:mRNA interferase MazF
LEVKRGDIIRIVLQGDFGKPRPAVIVQADNFSKIPSLSVLPFSTDLRNVPDVRITIEPTAANGLLEPSQIMVDKIATVSLKKVGQQIGHLSSADMAAVNRTLAVFLGLA